MAWKFYDIMNRVLRVGKKIHLHVVPAGHSPSMIIYTVTKIECNIVYVSLDSIENLWIELNMPQGQITRDNYPFFNKYVINFYEFILADVKRRTELYLCDLAMEVRVS